jgi:PAS domain S-box-containing protein
VLEARVRERTADLIRERDLARCYVEDAPVGIFIADAGGRYLDVNPAGCQLVRYSREELLGMTIGDLAPPGDRPAHLDLFARFIQKGEGSQELVLRQKNGTEILVSLKTVVLADKRVMGFCSDITEQRRTALQAVARAQELDLALKQLHGLSAHMHDSIEKERMTIASDIHDQIGASLTGANLLLNQLNTLAPDLPQAGREVLAQVQEIVSQTLISSRGVYTRLRPPMLNDLGLVETCRWYLQDWAKKSGIKVKQSLFRLPDEPPESIRLDIFRILQELLTNVARHSGATQVSGSLTRGKNYVLLKVKDNGQGFDAERMHEGFGLRGIRGRLNRHNGSMQIDKTSPGMEVSVQIPLNNGEVK